MINLGSVSLANLTTTLPTVNNTWTTPNTGLSNTNVLNPTSQMTLGQLADFSRTGVDAQTLFGVANGIVDASNFKFSDPWVNTVMPLDQNEGLAQAPSEAPVSELAKATTKKSNVENFLMNPLEQVNKLMKGETISEESIFAPITESLFGDAGLDDNARTQVLQQRQAQNTKSSQFGNTPYATVNAKKKAYIELARFDLQEALKMQDEAVKREEKRIADNKAAINAIIAQKK